MLTAVAGGAQAIDIATLLRVDARMTETIGELVSTRHQLDREIERARAAGALATARSRLEQRARLLARLERVTLERAVIRRALLALRQLH